MVRESQIVRKYMDSVLNRDIVGLLSIVSNDIVLILPNGKLCNGLANFASFHEDWFSDFDWELRTEVIRSLIFSHSESHLLKALYLDKDSEGKPTSIEYYLALTFQAENEVLKLTLDQNTLIRQS